jgi:anti-anti-sigma factor
MLTEVAHSWTFTVERGPDWLFVKLHGPDNGDAEGVPLAEMVWELMRQHLAHRVVLDLSDLRILRSYVIGQMVQLHKRIYNNNGLMRVCGLSDDNYSVLVACRLHERFPQYENCEGAVMGHRPKQPR